MMSAMLSFLPITHLRWSVSPLAVESIPALKPAGENLNKQLADRCFFVNGTYAAREQIRDTQNFNFLQLLGRFRKRYRIGSHNFADRRMFNALYRRPGEHRVGASGKDLRGAFANQSFGGFHQRTGGVDDVVHNQRAAASD